MLNLQQRRDRLRSVAARYFTEEELDRASIGPWRLRIGGASFKLGAGGQDLAVAKIPRHRWLRKQAGELEGDEKAWAVIGWIKVSRLSTPEEVIERARTGELYDENYFTKRGGGAPYIGYPMDSSGESSRGREGIAEAIAATSPGRVLDIGAATGVMVKELQDRGVQADGVDISEWAIENRVTDSVILGSALELPFEDQSFDTVTSQDFMEHMHPDDLPGVLAEQVRVTRPGGRLFHLIPYYDAAAYDAEEPFQLDAHLCQASREWWRDLFERTPGIEVVRMDEGIDAPNFIDTLVELRRT